MYGIIKETDGKNEEFTVYDLRSCRSVGIYKTLEEAQKVKETKNKELFQGSGVYGNTPTL